MIISIPSGYKIIQHGLKAHNNIVLASNIEDVDKIKCLISLENVVKLSYRFFKEYGYELNEKRYLTILFSDENIKMKDYEETWYGSEDAMLAGSANTREFEDKSMLGVIRLYINQNRNIEQLLEVLFHELDHVLWSFEGKEYSYSEEYKYRPHEIRARKNATFWLFKLIKEDRDLHKEANALRKDARKLLRRNAFMAGSMLGVNIKISFIYRKAQKIDERCLALFMGCPNTHCEIKDFD